MVHNESILIKAYMEKSKEYKIHVFYISCLAKVSGNIKDTLITISNYEEKKITKKFQSI